MQKHLLSFLKSETAVVNEPNRVLLKLCNTQIIVFSVTKSPFFSFPLSVGRFCLIPYNTFLMPAKK